MGNQQFAEQFALFFDGSVRSHHGGAVFVARMMIRQSSSRCEQEACFPASVFARIGQLKTLSCDNLPVPGYRAIGEQKANRTRWFAGCQKLASVPLPWCALKSHMATLWQQLRERDGPAMEIEFK
jgi:hypothetical protein